MTIKEITIGGKGFKRIAASVVLIVIVLLNTIPGCQEWAQALIPIAALLGAVGITNATLVGALTEKKAASIASALAVLLIVARFYPPLQPYSPFIEALAALFSAAGLTLVLPPVAKPLAIGEEVITTARVQWTSKLPK